MAQRAKAPEYGRLLGDCRGLYCEARLGLVAPVARARIAALAAQQLPALIRAGCAYLMQVRAPRLCGEEGKSNRQPPVSVWHRLERGGSRLATGYRCWKCAQMCVCSFNITGTALAVHARRKATFTRGPVSPAVTW